MSTARTRAWFAFGITGVVLLAVVSWLTFALLRLDHDELQARRQATLHERLRLALWRMDSWLAPQLAREAMRPASDYRAFPAAPAAWTRGLTRLQPDEVLVTSPLVGVESPLFALHFESGPDGLRSPQVPLGNERDVCEANGVDRAVLERAATRLRELDMRLDRQALQLRLGGAEASLPLLGCIAVSPQDPLVTQQSVQELSNRQRSVVQNIHSQQAAGNAEWNNNPLTNPAAATAEVVGPLLPVWLEATPPTLLFVRRVTGGVGERVQGVVVDWTRLERELVALVADLFTDARLLRCDQPTQAEQPSLLASIPARLAATCADDMARGLPLPWILASTWGVTLLGLGLLAFTLRTAIGYGERRARFASAVTHELRTPLTTFRMYSEMLADGVVQDPNAQREYLTTLQRESDRLARVVENVLAWSRLEEGRFTSRRESHRLGALVEHVVPTLQRRLAEADLGLEVAVTGGDTTLVTDEDAVGQILFNLVDNAAKYARDATDRRVQLVATADDHSVRFTIRDHGPGVPAAVRNRIFAPFDRGALPAGDNDVPGVGLGLALARGLARDLGGELRLDDAVHEGAAFVFELPRG